jgi:hypothetical protein
VAISKIKSSMGSDIFTILIVDTRFCLALAAQKL